MPCRARGEVRIEYIERLLVRGIHVKCSRIFEYGGKIGELGLPDEEEAVVDGATGRGFAKMV